MTAKGSVGATPHMSEEDMSGHQNAEMTAPSVTPSYKTPGPTRWRGVEANTNRDIKEPIVISDISADEHGSWINGVHTPNEVHGFPFKVREDR